MSIFIRKHSSNIESSPAKEVEEMETSGTIVTRAGSSSYLDIGSSSHGSGELLTEESKTDHDEDISHKRRSPTSKKKKDRMSIMFPIPRISLGSRALSGGTRRLINHSSSNHNDDDQPSNGSSWPSILGSISSKKGNTTPKSSDQEEEGVETLKTSSDNSSSNNEDNQPRGRSSWPSVFGSATNKSSDPPTSKGPKSRGSLFINPAAAASKSIKGQARRVSEFIFASPKMADTQNSREALWQHQTVKIRPMIFVMENEGEFEDDYELGKLLGQGGYGKVFECVHKESGVERAVKVLLKSDDEEQNAEIMQEFGTLREMEHPNILKNYALYQDDECMRVVTDLYKGGDLLDLIHERCLTERETAVLIKHALSCINYCHKNGIVHRDLKPDNILLEETQDFRDIKIIDFGIATRIEPNSDGDEDQSKIHGAAGSIYYMSPQVVEGTYTEACDIWSIGVICYMLMSGYAPFDADDDDEIIEQIMEGTLYFDDPVWEDISDDALDFVEYLCTIDEAKRPTAAQALKHPWLEKYATVDDDESEEGEANHQEQSIRTCLTGLKHFSTDCKLKQVVYSLIASQLLSKKDKESIDHDFRTLDLDCDGKLSRDDVQKSHLECYGVELAEEELDGIMTAVNYSASGDGIEYSEFVAATMMEKKLVTREMLTSAFHIIDADNTGYLCVGSIRHALDLDEQGTMDSYILHKIIEPVDSTGYGTISSEDFISMMMSSSSNNGNNKEKQASTKSSSNRRLLQRPKSLTRTFRDSLNLKIVSKMNLANISNNISSGSKAVVSGVSSGSKAVVDGVSSGSKAVVDGVASGSKAVVDGVASGSKAVVDGSMTIVNGVSSGVSSGSKAVVSGVSSGSKAVVSGVSSGSKAVVDGVASGSKAVVDGSMTIVNGVSSGVSSGSKTIARIARKSLTMPSFDINLASTKQGKAPVS